MTSVQEQRWASPKLRSDVVLGPPLQHGPRIAHMMKDQRTGRFFQVGPREFFIFSRLDGHTTLTAIGEQYAATFRRRLDERQWGQILGLLDARRLLHGADDEQALTELATVARQRHRGNQSLLLYRMPLVEPQRLFAAIEPRLRFLYTPWFLIPVLLAVVALEIAVALGAPRLLDDALRVWESPAAVAAALLVIWFSLVLHEGAHGLTCTHYGGTAPEVGILWRFPWLAPYCNAQDIVLFHERRHRLATVAAGPFASLVILLPFAPLWAAAGADSPLRHLAAAVLVFGSVGALANLLPLLRLDGYFLLSHALGMQDLEQESGRYLRSRLTGATGDARRAYPRRAAAIYALYGTASLLTNLALAVGALLLIRGLLERHVGVRVAWIILAGLVVLAAAVFALKARRSRSGSPT